MQEVEEVLNRSFQSSQFQRICRKGKSCRHLRSLQCTFVHPLSDLVYRKVLDSPHFQPLLLINMPTCKHKSLANCQANSKLPDNLLDSHSTVCDRIHIEQLVTIDEGLEPSYLQYVKQVRTKLSPHYALYLYQYERNKTLREFNITSKVWRTQFNHLQGYLATVSKEIERRRQIELQFKEELQSVETQLIFRYPAQIQQSTSPMTCLVCLNSQKPVFKCSDCSGMTCFNCFKSYLEGNIELFSVSRYEVCGFYCPTSQHTHTLVCSKTIRTLSNDDEELEIQLQSRYLREREQTIRIQAKTEALEIFQSRGQIGTAVQTIEEEIIRDICPNCRQPYISDGCESIKCECGWYFCNVCLVHKTRRNVVSHAHIKECIVSNIPNYVDMYYPGSQQRVEWRNRQRCRRIRDFLVKSSVDWKLVLVSLVDRHTDLRSFLLGEFVEPEYQVAIG